MLVDPPGYEYWFRHGPALIGLPLEPPPPSPPLLRSRVLSTSRRNTRGKSRATSRCSTMSCGG
jgi:hypothetical protein